MSIEIEETTRNQASDTKLRRCLAIVNPHAGRCTTSDVSAAIEQHLPADTWATVIHETSSDESIRTTVERALADGCDLVIAAGGDGTVSETAQALVGTQTPLGILPVGTANLLARDLDIPLELDAACALLSNDHAIRTIDAMQIGDTYALVSIGIGIYSEVVRATPSEAKRRFGRMAYAWTVLTNLVGYQQHRFTISADGKRLRKRALLVLVTSSPSVGLEPFRWGDHIRLDDGQIDICVITAHTMKDYIKVVWNALRGRQRHDANVRYLTARQQIAIATSQPLPIQVDGEIRGETPARIQVVPQALRIITP